MKSPTPRMPGGFSPVGAEGKGATVTTRFGKDGITFVDPNRASEGAVAVFQRI